MKIVSPCEGTGYEVGSMSLVNGARGAPEVPDFSRIKFIKYDFDKFGSSETRKRLLSRWTNEVKSLPK